MLMDGHMMAPWGWLFMLIFWALVIVALIYGVRWLAGRNGPEENGGGQTALDILKERYARGEISRKEFEQMKKDLE